MTRTNTTHPNFDIEAGLRPEHLDLAVDGYWDAFSQKLLYPLGPKAKALKFLRIVIDADHAISAVSKGGDFLGVAGFKTNNGAFVGGTFQDMVHVYGGASSILRAGLVGILERSVEPGTLLMDGIFVKASARGLGVGSALLDAIQSHAEACNYDRIRLDVIDSNPRARALYERRGFKGTTQETLGLLKPVFGFSSALKMVKPLNHKSAV